VSAKTAERFNAKWVVDLATGCWVWLGSTNGRGYGEIRVAGRKVYAHRWSVENSGRTIPAGFEVDHLCRNPSCVNPAHLDIVTHVENVMRGDVAGLKPERRAEFCSMGHRYSENTYVRSDGKGRNCIQCVRDRSREYQRRRRAAQCAS
jgi:hypothetical protein